MEKKYREINDAYDYADELSEKYNDKNVIYARRPDGTIGRFSMVDENVKIETYDKDFDSVDIYVDKGGYIDITNCEQIKGIDKETFEKTYSKVTKEELIAFYHSDPDYVLGEYLIQNDPTFLEQVCLDEDYYDLAEFAIERDSSAVQFLDKSFLGERYSRLVIKAFCADSKSIEHIEDLPIYELRTELRDNEHSVEDYYVVLKKLDQVEDEQVFINIATDMALSHGISSLTGFSDLDKTSDIYQDIMKNLVLENPRNMVYVSPDSELFSSMALKNSAVQDVVNSMIEESPEIIQYLPAEMLSHYAYVDTVIDVIEKNPQLADLIDGEKMSQISDNDLVNILDQYRGLECEIDGGRDEESYHLDNSDVMRIVEEVCGRNASLEDKQVDPIEL